MVPCMQIRKHYCVDPCMCPFCWPHLSNCRYYGYATYVTLMYSTEKMCRPFLGNEKPSSVILISSCDERWDLVSEFIYCTHTLYYVVKSMKDMHSINKMDTSIPTIYSEKRPLTEAKPAVSPITITCFCYHQLPRR